MLREWRDSDFEAFADMNSDPEVMRYFLAPMSRSEAMDAFCQIRSAMDRRGWGVWAVEVDGKFAGMVGLHVPEWRLPFCPCTEVLWRMRKEYWGRGIAWAAAREAVRYGFEEVGLDEIVAFTPLQNLRSIRLMERLGFERNAQEVFDHPAVPEGHHLRRHALYRKKRSGAAR